MGVLTLLYLGSKTRDFFECLVQRAREYETNPFMSARSASPASQDRSREQRVRDELGSAASQAHRAREKTIYGPSAPRRKAPKHSPLREAGAQEWFLPIVVDQKKPQTHRGAFEAFSGGQAFGISYI